MDGGHLTDADDAESAGGGAESGEGGEDDVTHGAINLAHRMKTDEAEAEAADKSRAHLLSSDEGGVHMYVPGTGVRHFALPRAGQTQEECYDVLGRPLLRSLWLGHDATLFAYGQTGTGKTYTMFGPGAGVLDDTDTSRLGVAPRLATDLMERCRRDRSAIATVYASFVEVYDERVYDLLNGGAGVKIPTGFDLDDRDATGLSRAGGAAAVAGGRGADRVLARRVFGIRGLDVSTVRVRDAHEVMELLREGSRMRAAAATDMNARSSRSHAIFTLKLVQTHRRSQVTLDSCMHLVDLAGSERVQATQTVRHDRMDELVSINKSLLSLGRCVGALSGGAKHVPYRESTLTRLLRGSLGGRCRTAMLVTLSADPKSGDETTASLRFAERTAAVKNVTGPVFGVPAYHLVHALKRRLIEMQAELCLLVHHDAQARAQHRATQLHSEACSRAALARTAFEEQHRRRVAVGGSAAGGAGSESLVVAAAKAAEREAAVELRAAVDQQTATGRELHLTPTSAAYVRLAVETSRLDAQLRALATELGRYGQAAPPAYTV